MRKMKKKGDKDKRSKSKGNEKPKKSKEKFARRKFRLQYRLKKAQESRLQTEVCLFTIAINKNDSKFFKVSWFSLVKRDKMQLHRYRGRLSMALR